MFFLAHGFVLQRKGEPFNHSNLLLLDARGTLNEIIKEYILNEKSNFNLLLGLTAKQQSKDYIQRLGYLVLSQSISNIKSKSKVKTVFVLLETQHF